MDSTLQSQSTRRANLLNKYLQDSRGKSIFVGASTTLFFIFFMLFGVIPTFNSIFSQISENKRISDTIELASKKLEDINKMEADSVEKSNVLGIFNKNFPEELSQKEVLNEIYELMPEGVYVRAIFFPEEIPVTPSLIIGSSPQVINVPITIQIEGEKRLLTEIVSDLETSKRIFNINSVRLTRKTEEQISEVGFERAYSLDLVVDYFYWLTDPIE